MSVVGSTNRFRLMINDSYRFAQDEVILQIVMKEQGSYRPVTLTCTIADEVIPYTPNTEISVELPQTVMPKELAELLLSAFGRYFLSSEGDLVATVERQKRDLARVTKQLEDLIAGIGRLSAQ